MLIDGCVRVSDILRILPKAVFLDAKLDFEFPLKSIDKGMLDAKCSIGTEVHAAIAADFVGDFYPLNDKEQGYFNSFLKWKNMLKPQPKMSEKRLFDKSLKITGQIDLVADIGVEALIDFKTSAFEDKDKWPLQAALYYLLLTGNGIVVNKRVSFVQLMPDGSVPKCYDYDMTKELLNMAISTVNLFKWLTRNYSLV